MAGKIMPNITGGTGEVLVVMDQFNWENSAGELLQDILKEEYPGLPQSEPVFDVIQVTKSSFDAFLHLFGDRDRVRKQNRGRVVSEGGTLYPEPSDGKEPIRRIQFYGCVPAKAG